MKKLDSQVDTKAVLTRYGAQSFRIRTNKTAVERNKIIEDHESSAPLIPEEWGYYSKTYICTHAGKYKSRGKGKRQRQQSRSINCKVQVHGCFVKC